MKKIIALLLAFSLLCITGCNFGGVTVNFSDYGSYDDADKYSEGSFTYSSDEIDEIEINWIDGEIEIIQSDKAALSVTENSDTLVGEEKLHYYINDGKLTIHYCVSGYKNKINGEMKKLQIEIPAGIALNIDNVNAKVNMGNITLDKFSLVSISGSTEISSVTANEVGMDSVSGDIYIREATASSFSIESVSANIEFAKVSADDINVDTVSGEVKVLLETCCDIDINTVFGSARIGLPGNFGAEVEFSTVSGSLNSDVEHTKNKDTYTFGNGEVGVKAETVSGDLYIE